MDTTVREVPGLYGSLSVSERLIQKIWHRFDFDANGLLSTNRQAIRVLSPGKWNLAGEGPDFLGAEIEIDGKSISGDVEIHFNASDWRAHGHHEDPNFSRVILHVVLFPPSSEEARNQAVTHRGYHPPTLALLPLLHEGLEEYAEREVIETLSGVGSEEILAEWLEIPLAERRARLHEHARERWQKKLSYAQKRLSGENWAEACHQFALEVLGYRRNRSPMGSLALRHPLSELSQKKADAETLFREKEGEWKLAGLRPANHPKTRLAQYLDLVGTQPNWPARLASLSPVSGKGETTRKSLGLAELQKRIKSEVFAGKIGGSRLDTLVVDGLLPLLAARLQTDLFPHWHHWYAGDLPPKLKSFLRESGTAGPGTGEPFSNGLLQGALRHFLERNLV